MGSRTAALAAGLLSFVALGCSSERESRGLTAGDLQVDLTSRLAASGTPPSSVECSRGLSGVVGSTARCAVNIGADRAVDVMLTAIAVDGGRVSYEISSVSLPAAEVSRQVSSRVPFGSAVCGSDLDGRVGAWTGCDVVIDGQPTTFAAEVTSVEGLEVDLDVVPTLDAPRVEELLQSKIAASTGARTEKAECESGLVGKTGESVRCRVTIDGNPEPFVLTVTGVSRGTVEFSYRSAREPGTKPGEEIDMCQGCPG